LPEHEGTNGVRVTNQAIYDKLVALEQRVASVDQSMTEVVKPTLNEQRLRLDRLEMRVYAILAGLIAAAIGAKGAGLI